MAYSAPGRADELDDRLLASWNEAIEAAYADLAELGSRFFTLDPGQLDQPGQATVKWFGDPAEPSFCIDGEAARALSDWGVRGRHGLHNEYCEYALVQRRDASGRLRPKRVQVTTELREYWSCMAVAHPAALREMATGVLGSEPSWSDLYGVADPTRLDEAEREIAFSHALGGNGGHAHLAQAGVPAQPTGPLNTENALFMTHPINGLDDLLYIVLFGAHPYAVSADGGRRPATREEIFISQGVEHLACRHADPAAAIGAHEAAWSGATVAFADPLGMYLIALATDLFLIRDEPVPAEWVRWGRGDEGMRQRLEFGPGDEDTEFLDDIVVAVGAATEPLTGGYQLLQQLEIGPLVVAAAGSPPGDDEFVDLDVPEPTIVCSDADVCASVATLKAEYDREHGTVRVAPRTVGPVG
jgi:hypothetical protein